MKQLKQKLNQELSFVSPVIRASVGFPRKLVLQHQIFHKQSACKLLFPFLLKSIIGIGIVIGIGIISTHLTF